MASTIPSFLSSNLIRNSRIIPQLYSSSSSSSSPRFPKPATSHSNPTLRWLSYASPPEYSPGTPPEFPGPGHGHQPLIPPVPPEVPEISTVPEIDPSSSPEEIVHTRPEDVRAPPPCPDPLPAPPGPDSPVPPLDPPRGPDTLPPPTGPDVIPPPDILPPGLPHDVPPWDPPRPIDPPLVV